MLGFLHVHPPLTAPECSVLCVSASLVGSPRHTPPGRSNSAIDSTAARRANVRQQYSQRGRLGMLPGASLRKSGVSTNAILCIFFYKRCVGITGLQKKTLGCLQLDATFADNLCHMINTSAIFHSLSANIASSWSSNVSIPVFLQAWLGTS